MPPANEYTYTTPPGEFVGPAQPPTTAPVTPPTQVTPTPLPPAAPPVSVIPPWMPEGSAVYGEQNGRPIFVTPDGSLYTGTGDSLGNVTPPGQTMGPPAPVAPPTAPGPEYTYTTPPGEVVGPPAPPVVAPPTAPVVAPPTAPGPEYTYTTPPGEVVGPPAPTPVEPPLSPLVPGDSTPRPPVVNVDLTQPPPLSPLTPGDSTPRPPVTEVDITQPPAPAPVEVRTPATPYVPVPTPPVGQEPAAPRGYGPITPLEFGDVGRIYNPGLNPGFVQPTPFYRTSSPVQSKFYWGQHPYQPGPTFDQTLYNTVPGAPQQPFGLQHMYTPTDLNQYLNQFTAGPVAPR
jgi:hypothetical protein